MPHILVAKQIAKAIYYRILKYERAADELLLPDGKLPPDLKERYEAIGNITEGLHEAMGIVMKGEYMKEDVNASGGEQHEPSGN